MTHTKSILGQNWCSQPYMLKSINFLRSMILYFLYVRCALSWKELMIVHGKRTIERHVRRFYKHCFKHLEVDNIYTL